MKQAWKATCYKVGIGKVGEMKGDHLVAKNADIVLVEQGGYGKEDIKKVKNTFLAFYKKRK